MVDQEVVATMTQFEIQSPLMHIESLVHNSCRSRSLLPHHPPRSSHHTPSNNQAGPAVNPSHSLVILVLTLCPISHISTCFNPIKTTAIPSILGTKARRMSFFRKKQPSASTLGPPAGSSTMTTTVPMNASGGAQVTVAQTPSQALAQLKASQASGGEPQMTGVGKDNDA